MSDTGGRIRKLITILPLLLFLSSCFYRVKGLEFKDSADRRHSVFVLSNNRNKYLYKLKPAVKDSGKGKAFFLKYMRNNSPLNISVLSSRNNVSASGIVPENGSVPVKYLISLPADLPVWGFAVSGTKTAETPAAEGRPDGLKDFAAGILDAGITGDERGFYFKDGTLIIGSGIKILKPEKLGNGYFKELSVRILKPNPEFNAVNSGAFWRIGLAFKSGDFGEPVSFIINIKGGSTGEHVLLKVNVPPGKSRVFLYPGTIGFFPGLILSKMRIPHAAEKNISGESTGTGLTGLFITTAISGEKNSMVPLPADLGSILKYNRAKWRRKEFEFYSWNLFPHILVLDTADYGIQSRLLKRIAFFVEKKGFAGTIPDEKKITNLHGYNAHDYRAADLAGFFNKAGQDNIGLIPAEELLKKILIKNGIIKVKGDNIVAGTGGLISISQNSSAILRKLLLTHESFHGIFFSVPGYRKSCFKVWDMLSDTEKKFWKLFLDWKKYDINNKYLVVNEFQAYLFQQRERDAVRYFGDYIIPKMVKFYDNKKDKLLNGFSALYPDHFRKTYEKLQRYLWENAGVRGGDDFNIEFKQAENSGG
ncbi:MAG: hypothetical protein GXP33_09045 [Spirochaetes bacterium]|nr:hypothetical protein [Spirochaetota bacterium]